MLGNPYSSLEPGMGPLMRDVKNKICTDCELVALLEDDNGMELLVCNKIMSLDLPVKDVYKKVSWKNVVRVVQVTRQGSETLVNIRENLFIKFQECVCQN